MNVLFLSMYGSALPFTQRVLREGHRSYLYINQREARGVGEGLVEKPALRSKVAHVGVCDKGELKVLLKEVAPDLVVIDTYGFGEAGDYCRQKGIPTIGGGRWADLAEINSEYGRKLMRTVGIDGLAESNGKKEVQVQVGVEMWWNGLDSIVSYWTMQERRFMSGGVGPTITCAGAVVAVPPQNSRLIKDSIHLVGRLLKRTNFRGLISMELLVSQDKLYGIRLAPRMVFDTVQPFFELFKGRMTDFLLSISNSSPYKMELYSGYAISIRLSIPPYPYAILYPHRTKIGGLSRENERHVWLSDARGEDRGYTSAGFDGYVATVTARGGSVREARRRAYRTVANLAIPDVQYRTDIGERVRSREIMDEWKHRPIRVVGEETLLRRWGWI